MSGADAERGADPALVVAGLQRPLAIALVYLRAQGGGDFFADTPFCLAASELRAAGHSAKVYEVFFARGDPARSAALLAELVELLRVSAVDLVVVEHLWQPEFVDAVMAMGAQLLLTEPDAELGRRIDFRLQHLTSHRQPLHDLVATLQQGGDLRALANLWVELLGMREPLRCGPEIAHPTIADALRPFAPVLDVVQLGDRIAEDGSQPPTRKTLDTNKGCPFSAPVAENPAFSQVPMPAQGVTMAGCSFCFMGGDYKALAWRQAVPLHLDQIAWYQAQMPAQLGRSLDEVVLRDQHAIRYLPQLLQGAIDRGLAPVGLLLPGRGDAILRFGAELRAAAEIAAGTGFWFCIYLIGFESFSQAQLDLYNKGVTVQEYADALQQLRALHLDHPDSFRLYAHGSSSFVLWNPWTTLEDLEATTAFARREAVWALAHGIGDTRLRLYRHLPLWWKAKHDGLLATDLDEGDAGATWTGYAAATPWRAADGRLARCEELASQLLRQCRPSEALGALETATAWTRRRWPEPLPPLGREELATHADWQADRAEIAACVAGWCALRQAWQRRPQQASTAQAAPRVDHSSRQRAAARTVLLGRWCNNDCLRCVGEHAVHDDDIDRLLVQVRAAARASADRVVITGREPLLVKGLPGLLRAAKAEGARSVEVVTNGRALAIAGVATRLAAAGCDAVTVKRHRLHDADEDLETATPGAGVQMWTGVARLRTEAPRLALRLLLVPTPLGWSELESLVQRAAELGAQGVTIRVLAGNTPADGFDEAQRALAQAQATANRLGLRTEVEGF